jgi:hypothetical protein
MEYLLKGFAIGTTIEAAGIFSRYDFATERQALR